MNTHKKNPEETNLVNKGTREWIPLFPSNN